MGPFEALENAGWVDMLGLMVNDWCMITNILYHAWEQLRNVHVYYIKLLRVFGLTMLNSC